MSREMKKEKIKYRDSKRNYNQFCNPLARFSRTDTAQKLYFKKRNLFFLKETFFFIKPFLKGFHLDEEAASLNDSAKIYSPEIRKCKRKHS